MDAISSVPQSTPGQEGSSVHDTDVKLLRAENDTHCIELAELHVRLLRSQTYYQSEVQIRQTIQRSYDMIQQKYFQLTASYKSRLSKYGRELAKLQEDNRTAEELVASQRRLIEMYEARDQQQQQPTSQLVDGGPLVSQYNGHNHSQYSTYQPPQSQEFIIDPTRLHPLNDLDYSIGSPIEPPRNTDVVISTPTAEFGFQAPLQSTPHPTSAECDIPGPNYTKSDEKDEGTKPSKKRRK